MMKHGIGSKFALLLALALVALPLVSSPVAAGDGDVDSGDTAWLMISTGLVFIMTPAVAFFYGAIVLAARLTGLIVEPGYAPTVLLISGFGALNAPVGLAVVGAYAWRAFENTKGPSAGDRAAADHVRGGRTTVSIFLHPQAICETKKVGPRTRIWAFAHVLPGARIGADCNICDHTFIENDVQIGDRVTVKCGVQLWDGARIGNDVFIGPNATFSNDIS